jgi:uncharacterized protein YjiS (DUF1127 family)
VALVRKDALRRQAVARLQAPGRDVGGERIGELCVVRYCQIAPRSMIPLTRYISGLLLQMQRVNAPMAVMSFPRLNRFGGAAGRRRRVAHRKVALEPQPLSNRHIGRPERWFDKLDRVAADVGVPRAARVPLLWFRRVHNRRELASLDAARLQDVGLSEQAIRREVAKPFWQE